MMKDLKTPLRYPGGKSRADFLFDEKNMPVKKSNSIVNHFWVVVVVVFHSLKGFQRYQFG